MMRVIVSPAALPADALQELKAWLGVASSVNDGELARLLATATDICADFIGLLPLACGCEEMLPLPMAAGGGMAPWDFAPDWRWSVPDRHPDWRAAVPGWRQLDTRPVLSVSGVSGVAVDGTRTALDAGTFAVRIDAEGTCSVRVSDPRGFSRCVVQLTAGLAPGWDALPSPLRQGIIALAGAMFQGSAGPVTGTTPPASVAALWLPWRRVRIA